ncbi:hypothetical protein TRIUR3_29380 [Triticum urartu]|uniref:Uncharacterized protein n=1 Tax=Triticum urartu TaxID=4572 RepID=M8AN52_TRIUA|nr:hypothetical protein TRIUR3_29380 [Triticum urartu]
MALLACTPLAWLGQRGRRRPWRWGKGDGDGRRRRAGSLRSFEGDGAEAGGDGGSGRGWRERWWLMGEVMAGGRGPWPGATGTGPRPGRREKWSGLEGEVVTGDGVWISERNQREIVVGERDRGGGEDKGESAARGGVRTKTETLDVARDFTFFTGKSNGYGTF